MRARSLFALSLSHTACARVRRPRLSLQARWPPPALPHSEIARRSLTSRGSCSPKTRKRTEHGIAGAVFSVAAPAALVTLLGLPDDHVIRPQRRPDGRGSMWGFGHGVCFFSVDAARPGGLGGGREEKERFFGLRRPPINPLSSTSHTPAPPCHSPPSPLAQSRARPLAHSAAHRFRQASFQAGT